MSEPIASMADYIERVNRLPRDEQRRVRGLWVKGFLANAIDTVESLVPDRAPIRADATP